jgi:UDP-GlcNAc3NAcA epimerase
MLKIVTVLGARPQFIKAAAVSRMIRTLYEDRIEEVLVHTGQHYDNNMSKVFFDELAMPTPRYNLAIAGGNHGAMTGRMLEAVESVLLKEMPDWVLIYGDTNSTLAGALAASKLNIPVAHVEAGLRSFNMRMPEEINRILSDRVSTLLFCPTSAAVHNLSAEGIIQGVHNVGDVMYDAALYFKEKSPQKSNILELLKISPKKYILVTCHRAENTDDLKRLGEIVSALAKIAEQSTIVLPLHPRTRKLIERNMLSQLLAKVKVIEPLSYLDMIALEQSAEAIITDSGGVQKEAYFFRVPCLTMRDETEWLETISSNANVLVGANQSVIIEWFSKLRSGQWSPNFGIAHYGLGNSARSIINILSAY